MRYRSFSDGYAQMSTYLNGAWTKRRWRLAETAVWSWL
jgi:hypothetical protein